MFPDHTVSGSRHGKIAKENDIYAFVLPAKLRARAEVLAAKDDRSLAWWMRRCVRERVEADEAKANPPEAVI